MIKRKFRLAVIGALALVLQAGAAHAGQSQSQVWLDDAFPARPALGASKAVGAVIWSHGRSVDSEDSQAPIPPYMAALRDGGWDTFRYNRMRASDTLSNSAAGLAQEVHRLKQQGYREVALAGQSFG